MHSADVASTRTPHDGRPMVGGAMMTSETEIEGTDRGLAARAMHELAIRAVRIRRDAVARLEGDLGALLDRVAAAHRELQDAIDLVVTSARLVATSPDVAEVAA